MARSIQNGALSACWLVNYLNKSRPSICLRLLRSSSLSNSPLSPSQRLPLGILKIAMIEKIESVGSLSSLFSLPIVSRALSNSFSPASPQHQEASAEEREFGTKQTCKLQKKQFSCFILNTLLEQTLMSRLHSSCGSTARSNLF